jgi:hypothetical protein
MPQRETTNCDFEMTVADVFAFDDGRTVFAGEVISGPNYIPACDCELLVRSTPVATFRIEGEMLPLNKTQKNLRSVSTKEKVDIALVRYSKGPCKLRGKMLPKQHLDSTRQP